MGAHIQRFRGGLGSISAARLLAFVGAVLLSGTLPACSPATGGERAAAPASGGAQRSAYPLDRARPADPATGEMTALAQYVAADDGAFKWELVRTVRVDGDASRGAPALSLHAIALTSQRWLTDADVDVPLWTHWLLIAVPDEIRSDVPIVMVGGGRRRDTPPERAPGELIQLARGSGAVVAYVSNVPNQPLRFKGDSDDRFEDAIVAESWSRAAGRNDASRVVLFPMVKAAVKATDALYAFLNGRDLSPATFNGRPLTGGLTPSGVFLTGASKRGWTTWLAASVDKRVRGMAPLVIDILDFNAQIRHHYAGYGFYAPALRDYENARVIARLNDKGIQGVVAHVDPINYLDRVRDLPTLSVIASSDEFFPTDSSRFYADKLGPAGRVRVIPNTGHDIRGSSVGADVLAFKAATEAGIRPPTIGVEPAGAADADGSRRYRATIRVPDARTRPLAVRVWSTINPNARDFRKDEGAAAWEELTPVAVAPLRPTPPAPGASSDSGDAYAAEFTVPTPAPGYRAFFVEARFAHPAGELPLTVTSVPVVLPEAMPFTPPK